MASRFRFGGPMRPGLLRAACLVCLLPAPAPVEAQRLGRLPAGMSPDSVDFTTTELYMLERGTVSVFSLPGLVRLRTFGGSGRGRGRLSPNHTFDQAIRVTGQGVLAEDNEKLILFSPDGQVIAETRKPENTVWFVPVGDGYVAKSMVVSGKPPAQVMRLVLYDRALREVKELYRQPWFQQRQGSGFSTELLGDLLHFAVVQDRIAVEESPKGFVIEIFDAAGAPLRTIAHSGSGVPVTAADKARELALVRTEKRVAAMSRMAGSWEKLRQIWTITFPAVTPPLREVQASGHQLLARTFERNGDTDKHVLLNLNGSSPREFWLPRPTDAETEARVSGTAFYKLVGDRFYYLRHDTSSNRWDVHVATVPDDRDAASGPADRADSSGGHQAGSLSWRTAGGGTVDTETMDANLRRLAGEPGITALSVGVIDDGQTVFARTIGIVDRKTRRPADERTVFRAASLSKPVFAYLVMRLVDEGVLNLDTPVVRYLPKPLPAYPAYASLRQDPRYQRLTARLLLSHQSGFPNWRRVRPSGPIWFDADPGKHFGYSGEGYRLLQFAVETATGRELSTLARDKVFGPLRMSDSSFLWEPRFDGRFAVELDSGIGRLIQETRHTANAAASLVTTAADYARFLAAVLNGDGLSPGSRAALLEPAIALTSRSLFSAPGSDAGTNRPHRLAWTPGWGTFSDEYGPSIFHVGREEGCENYVEARLDRGPGIVILSAGTSSDSFSAPLVDAAIGSLYSPLAWLEYGRPVQSEPAARALGWGLAGLAVLFLVLVVWRAGRLAKHVSWR
jgi:CubicO group peptidase (beta-lactamase class C family)